MKALRSVIIWTFVSAILAAAAAWLLWLAGCLYSPAVPLCRHDHGGAIVALAGLLLAIIPVAYTARQRALRAVGRGMYARPVGGPGRMQSAMAAVMHFIVEGELEQRHVGDEKRGWHPLLDIDDGDGWIVPLSDGSAVIVRWGDFRAWLYEAWEIQQDPKRRRQGATSQRTWDRRIGRDQTLARNHLLAVAGGVRRNRTTANSTRRIDGSPWGILERLAAEWPPERIE